MIFKYITSFIKKIIENISIRKEQIYKLPITLFKFYLSYFIHNTYIKRIYIKICILHIKKNVYFIFKKINKKKYTKYKLLNLHTNYFFLDDVSINIIYNIFVNNMYKSETKVIDLSYFVYYIIYKNIKIEKNNYTTSFIINRNGLINAFFSLNLFYNIIAINIIDKLNRKMKLNKYRIYTINGYNSKKIHFFTGDIVYVKYNLDFVFLVSRIIKSFRSDNIFLLEINYTEHDIKHLPVIMSFDSVENYLENHFEYLKKSEYKKMIEISQEFFILISNSIIINKVEFSYLRKIIIKLDSHYEVYNYLRMYELVTTKIVTELNKEVDETFYRRYTINLVIDIVIDRKIKIKIVTKKKGTFIFSKKHNIYSYIVAISEIFDYIDATYQEGPEEQLFFRELYISISDITKKGKYKK